MRGNRDRADELGNGLGGKIYLGDATIDNAGDGFLAERDEDDLSRSELGF